MCVKVKEREMIDRAEMILSSLYGEPNKGGLCDSMPKRIVANSRRLK